MGSLPSENPTLSPSTLRPSISTADLRSSLPQILSPRTSPEKVVISTSLKMQKPKGIIGKSNKTLRPSVDKLVSLEKLDESRIQQTQ